MNLSEFVKKDANDISPFNIEGEYFDIRLRLQGKQQITAYFVSGNCVKPGIYQLDYSLFVESTLVAFKGRVIIIDIYFNLTLMMNIDKILYQC